MKLKNLKYYPAYIGSNILLVFAYLFAVVANLLILVAFIIQHVILAVISPLKCGRLFNLYGDAQKVVFCKIDLEKAVEKTIEKYHAADRKGNRHHKKGKAK